ncbi:hypothetical protein AZ34_05170 [Hylemonella gracilis str. Niagara R]|uniref:Uncharacterized protein n=1 Tax=Hylemonella gracilis str. Niagara R TaxID=1458275 RepID=A0A016XLT1_9BURK|nr:hypothetical protein [Hylemonella gracilis]EYC52806.1 hypothetical protein AZ34_05170 [Hylemonella gracilis str. Niagara R]
MARRLSIIFPLRRSPCDFLGICQQRRPPCRGCSFVARWDSPQRKPPFRKRLVAVWMAKLLGASVLAFGSVLWLWLLIVETPR